MVMKSLIFLIILAILFLGYNFFLNKKVVVLTNPIDILIKNNIQKGMKEEDAKSRLEELNMAYHIDKNGNIDISGQGITIEIDNLNKVIKFSSY